MLHEKQPMRPSNSVQAHHALSVSKAFDGIITFGFADYDQIKFRKSNR
jgi:hypothetical protein